MREQTLVYSLLALGTVLLLANSAYSESVRATAESALGPAVAQQLCQQQGGVPVLAAPTSQSSCAVYSDLGKLDPVVCSYFNGQKASACAELFSILSLRTQDCLAVTTSNSSTQYADGDPQAVQDCATLQN